MNAPALVLGSTQLRQPGELAALEQRGRRSGFEVVRRRSGGGAVWLDAESQVWADVFIARDDPLWLDDVGRAFWWLGEVWVDALAQCGVSSAAIHRGGLCTTRWSRQVCFAGLGSGEVTLPVPGPGPKVVGIAQRRTSEGALFQCSALLQWDPAPLVAALALPSEAIEELAPAATGLRGVTADALEASLLACLP